MEANASLNSASKEDEHTGKKDKDQSGLHEIQFVSFLNTGKSESVIIGTGK